MKYYMLITDDIICITKLFDRRFIPYLEDFPYEMREYLIGEKRFDETARFFREDSLSQLQRILYKEIGFDELYKIGANYGLERLVNHIINR